jgi:1-acyl-sn-glycerol-3-phosphate acyltransferase
MKLHGLLRKFAWLLARLLFGLQIVHAEVIPKEGPVMLVSNHLSILDPIVIGIACPRPVSFIARSELFRMPILSWLLPKLQAIPVDRGQSDMGAIKAAIRVLRAGGVFGVFPEGTRSRDGLLKEFRSGAAAIALRTGATVVPVGLVGTHRAWPVGRGPQPGQKIQVVFGNPIVIEPARIDVQALQELTERLRREVARLLPPEYVDDKSLLLEQSEQRVEESSR